MSPVFNRSPFAGCAVLAALGILAVCVPAAHPTPAIPRIPGQRASIAATVAADNLLLGNPDNANGDSENRDHYLVLRKQYALSYNDNLRFLNWVAWRLAHRGSGSWFS